MALPELITIPLYSLLGLYGLFLLAVGVFFIVNILNLARTGTFTMLSFWATFLFLSLSILIVWTTWHFLQGVNWQEPITIWNRAWIGRLLGSVFSVKPL